ncbi:hypothetical protein K1Y32_13515, partial [Staphylococcus gallinarum]|uniref:hypothetical protein n=1 Tax=Staphylococcus gallinarum TaxID=1293 RepID=UPI001E350139
MCSLSTNQSYNIYCTVTVIAHSNKKDALFMFIFKTIGYIVVTHFLISKDYNFVFNRAWKSVVIFYV